MRLQELTHISSTNSIFCECAQRLHASLVLLFHFIPALLIDFHQSMAAILQSKKGVLNLVSRNKVVTIHYLLIMLADTHTHLVQLTVHFQSQQTLTCHASPLVSRKLGFAVIFQLNCACVPSTVIRPMTGTVPSFFTTCLLR